MARTQVVCGSSAVLSALDMPVWRLFAHRDQNFDLLERPVRVYGTMAG
jgi:hypothetical protein